MVLSELAAATMIAICGFKNSYRIILKGERLVRRRIRRPSPILDGYDSFPRFFIRKVFRAGLVIAMRWEGRAKNAAQLATDARMRARSAQTAVKNQVEAARTKAEDVRLKAKLQADQMREKAAEMRQRAEDVRAKAKDQAALVRERAAAVRKRAEGVRTKAQDSAALVREKAAEVRQRAEGVKEAAIAAKDRAVEAKDRVVEISSRVQERISSGKKRGDSGRKISTGAPALSGKVDADVSDGRRAFHSVGLGVAADPVAAGPVLVRTRFI